MCRFCRQRMGTRLRNLRCLLMQIDRVEPHHPSKGLAVGKTTAFFHQHIAMFGGDLDMIAKYGVVTDLEYRNAGLLPVARFEQGNSPPPIARHIAQRI